MYCIVKIIDCKVVQYITFPAAVTNLPAITGPDNVCVGSTIQLQNAMPNGVWSSLNISANIDAANGLLTGANGGIANIRYTITNAFGCSNFASTAPSINIRPGVPGIAYAAGSPNPQNGAGGGNRFCNNRVFNLVGNPVGGAFSSSNNAVFTVNNAGQVNTVGLGNATLTYTVSNANGCTNSRSIAGTVVACAARGVRNSEELNANSYELYPNPATSLLTINCKLVIGFGKLLITDYLGRTVKEQIISMGPNTIDVSKFTKGMYMVSIVTEQGKETKKLLIE